MGKKRKHNPFTTGNPFLGTKLLVFSIGRGSGALKGLTSPHFHVFSFMSRVDLTLLYSHFSASYVSSRDKRQREAPSVPRCPDTKAAFVFQYHCPTVAIFPDRVVPGSIYALPVVKQIENFLPKPSEGYMYHLPSPAFARVMTRPASGGVSRTHGSSRVGSGQEVFNFHGSGRVGSP